MSILVKGMIMPKNCFECPMMTDYDTCGFYAMRSSRSELEAQWNARPDDCPLVEIPTSHGRLIEEEPIIKYITDGLNIGKFGYDAIEVMAEIKYAPTIIPAEPPKEET